MWVCGYVKKTASLYTYAHTVILSCFPPWRTRRGRFLCILGGIVLVALVLRLAVSAQLLNGYWPVRNPARDTDTGHYQYLAGQVLDGKYDYSQGFYFQPFYYTVYLPVVYTVFGRGPWGVIIVQALLGAACVWLTGLAFARLFGKKAGIMAAGLLALCRLHIFYTPFTLIACLQTFWLCLIFYCAVRAVQRRAWWLWAVTGLLCGLANSTRGNIILLLPCVIALLIWSLRRQKARLFGALALLLTLFYLPQLPFAWKNYQVKKRWVGASYAAPNVLALGNTPESPPGGREPGSSGPMEYPQSYYGWVAQATRFSGAKKVTLLRNMWGWFTTEPLAYLELKFRMFLLFWNKMEIPNNVSMFEGDKPVKSWLLHLPVLLDFWLLGGLGFAGLVLSLWIYRKKPLLLFAGGMVVFYCGSIVLFYMLARFRLPIVPMLCGFGGATLALAWRRGRRWREKNKRRGLVYGGLLILLSLGFVAFGYDIYRYGWESAVMRVVQPAGVRVELPGRRQNWPGYRLVKDHGPYSFGGWLFLPADGLEVHKILMPGKPPAAFARLKLRVALMIQGPTQIELTLYPPGATQAAPLARRVIQLRPKKQYVPEHWVAMELPPGSYVYSHDDGSLALSFRLKQLGGNPASAILDRQRDYGRTRLNQETPPGEMVVELQMRMKVEDPGE